MLAYCIAANCNNSQATQSITMHEFPRDRLAVRRKWVKFVQFKRADFEAAPQSRPLILCSEHFAECDFVNFMVWFFFLCHKHLWSVLSFFATEICVQSLSFTAFPAVGVNVRLFVFALLALVSGYQSISQFLVSCHQLHPWRFELDFFPQVSYPVDSPTNSDFKQTPFGISP